MLNYLKTLLALKWNHRVALARGGEQALDLLKGELQPDLVLLDICMPNIDGLEVLRRLGSLRGPKERPPVIILSRVENVKTVVEAIRLGAMNYLLKPFGEEELMAAIHQALERNENPEEVKTLRDPIRPNAPIIPLTKSKAMEKVVKLVEQVADTLVQSKLLQVIEQGKFSHLGGKRDIEVDVRIVAATNRDLEAAVRAGTFRGDLYYRINVIGIVIPPLRERKDDIPGLCQYFLDQYNARYNRRRKGLSKELTRLFIQYDWPGNVREAGEHDQARGRPGRRGARHEGAAPGHRQGRGKGSQPYGGGPFQGRRPLLEGCRRESHLQGGTRGYSCRPDPGQLE